MATAVSAGVATSSVKGGVGLCNFRDNISYRSSSEVGVLEYVYGIFKNFGDLSRCH